MSAAGREVLWTRDEARAFDRRMTDEVGVPGVVLMENAGRGASDWMLRRADELGLTSGPCCVLCGGGNNGGDGYVLARHLSLGGVDVSLVELAGADDLRPDAAVFRAVCEELGMPMASWCPGEAPALRAGISCWVDGVLGTGFQAPIRPHARAVLDEVERLRRSTGAPVVALDMPSGVDSDRGIPAEGALRADFTLTFGAMKVGLNAPEGRSWAGEVAVIGLGVPVG